MEDGKYVDGSLYFYAPNKGGAIFFSLAFLISTVLHAWQCRHYRSWRLTGLYVFSGMLFVAGFVVRTVAAFVDIGNVNLYITTICLVYAAPPMYELANYHVLGRVLYYVPQLSPLHPGRVLTTFGMLSAVVEALNANGAAYSANSTLSSSRQKAGHNLLKAALLMQVVIIALFAVLTAVYHHRCHRSLKTVAGAPGYRNVFNALLTLYISTALLLIRTIYRVVEYFTIANLNVNGSVDASSVSPILRYEWFFYFFEASLMCTNTFLINARHPRRYLPASNKTCLSLRGPDGSEGGSAAQHPTEIVEITGQGYQENRPLILTIFDPFNLQAVLERKNNAANRKVWDDDEVSGAPSKQPQSVLQTPGGGQPRNRDDPEAA